MIKNIEYIAVNGVLIRFELNGQPEEIGFSDIASFWNYAAEEDFEGGKVKSNGDTLWFSMLTASSQGGIIVGWDCVNKTVIHISAAPYVIDFAVYKSRIYYLCEIYSFVTPYHYELFSIPLYTKDLETEGDRIYCQHPCELVVGNGKIRLNVLDKGIFVRTDTAEYLYTDMIEGAEALPLLLEYKDLYVTEGDPSIVLKKRGWLT